MIEIKKKLLRVDWTLTRALRSMTRYRVLTVFFGFFAHAGDSMVVVPLLLLWWIVRGIDDYSYFIPLWGALFTASVITVVLKFGFRRNRPEGGRSGYHRKADPYSFPSGHAVRCFCIAACVIGAYSPRVGAELWLWATLVTSGRIVQGIHYVSDVIAGAVMGIAIGLVFAILTASGVFSGY